MAQITTQSVMMRIHRHLDKRVKKLFRKLYQENTSIDEDEMLAKLNEDQFVYTSDCLELVSCDNEEHLYMAMEWMNNSAMDTVEPSYLRYDAATVFNSYWRHYIYLSVDVGDWLEDERKPPVKTVGVKRVVKVRRDKNSSDEE